MFNNFLYICTKLIYMKRFIILFLLIQLSTFSYNNEPYISNIEFIVKVNVKLLYECEGSLYNATIRQCDDTPLITGSGAKINLETASKQRIVAISQEMLNSDFRLKMLDDTIKDIRFRGKIKYGDSIWVESPKEPNGEYMYPNINGWWHVEDTKNKRYVYSDIKLDFLQTIGDKKLYNGNYFWNGKFEKLKIYNVNPHVETFAFIN